MRPEPVECSDLEDTSLLARLPHGAPLLYRGRLQAASRDASFLRCPDVYSLKASHVVVVSHRYAVGGGIVTATAACSPTQIMVDTGLVRDALDVHPNGRCTRPGCRELFTRASVTAQPVTETAPVADDDNVRGER